MQKEKRKSGQRRFIPTPPDIQRWRKANLQRKELRKQLALILHEKGFSRETAYSWFRTPLPALGDVAPLDCKSPRRLKQLLSWVRRNLAPASEL